MSESLLKARYGEVGIEAGCDEAGRGCLAGPVFAAAVILPEDFHHPWLNDSKQINATKRAHLREYIEMHALAYAVANVGVVEIDEINILNASFRAMHEAIDQLSLRPELLLIDGNRFPAYLGIAHQCIIKGDATYQSIAAASILAKTYRDEFMIEAARTYPMYGWEVNKGYGTLAHRQAMSLHGVSPLHRKTFKWKL